MGLAWAANWYAVKAWASRSLRQARWHERGPGESLFACFILWGAGCRAITYLLRTFSFGLS